MWKISIIVPVYNVEKYLSCCIKSIVSQTYADFELILVDDGSTDNSGKMCDEWSKKDNRIIVIHKENGGVASARNTGLDIAKGKYITFVDSDDWIEQHFLEDAIKECKKYKLDIFLSGYTRNNLNNIQKNIHTFDASLSENEYIELLCCSYISSVWGNLIRKTFIGYLRFDDMCFGEDLTFMFDILKKSPKLYAVPKAYYNYRNTENSLTKTTSFNKLNDIVKTYKYLLDFSKELNLKSSFYKHIQCRYLIDLYSTQQAILNSKGSFIYKFKALSILISDKELQFIIRNSNDKYHKRYSSHPFLLIIYHKYLYIKRELL